MLKVFSLPSRQNPIHQLNHLKPLLKTTADPSANSHALTPYTAKEVAQKMVEVFTSTQNRAGARTHRKPKISIKPAHSNKQGSAPC